MRAEKKAKAIKEREEAKKARERLAGAPPYAPPGVHLVPMLPIPLPMQMRLPRVPQLPQYDVNLHGPWGPTPPMSSAPSLSGSPTSAPKELPKTSPNAQIPNTSMFQAIYPAAPQQPSK